MSLLASGRVCVLAIRCSHNLVGCGCRGASKADICSVWLLWGAALWQIMLLYSLASTFRRRVALMNGMRYAARIASVTSARASPCLASLPRIFFAVPSVGAITQYLSCISWVGWVESFCACACLRTLPRDNMGMALGSNDRFRSRSGGRKGDGIRQYQRHGVGVSVNIDNGRDGIGRKCAAHNVAATLHALAPLHGVSITRLAKRSALRVEQAPLSALSRVWQHSVARWRQVNGQRNVELRASR